MDFVNSGAHCSVSECKQQDFLPFTCDHCDRKFCLAHRTYEAHDCEGRAAKDIHSIACPICNKSVVFNKLENVDEVWERHYLNNCTKEAAPKNKKKIVCSHCKITKLGPSNKFTCSKCNKLLCLKCRIPENHNCSAARRTNQNAAIFNRMTNSNSGSSNNNGSRSNGNSSHIGSSRGRDNNYTNRSSYDNDGGSGGGGIETCPICSKRFQDVMGLVNHVELSHPSGFGATSNDRNNNSNNNGSTTFIDMTTEESSSSRNNNNNNNNNNNYDRNRSSNRAGIEACPMCGAHFTDPVELIQHVESHSHNNQGRGREGGGNSDSNKRCRLS